MKRSVSHFLWDASKESEEKKQNVFQYLLVYKRHLGRLVGSLPAVLVELNLVKASMDVDLVFPGTVHRVNRDLFETV